jgi:hypothetical protein
MYSGTSPLPPQADDGGLWADALVTAKSDLELIMSVFFIYGYTKRPTMETYFN